jgi:hypothetical protein
LAAGTIRPALVLLSRLLRALALLPTKVAPGQLS